MLYKALMFSYNIFTRTANTNKETTAINTNDINFSELMDLRIDYAFKLFFATGDTVHLVSLLNAIFENKQIQRVVTDLTVVNPSLEKTTIEDKLSILDIRAALSDNTSISIEMHLYDLLEHKFKAVRSWARIYGESLLPGQEYTEQNQVVCISFMNGPVTDAFGNPLHKLHSLFTISERDSYEVLLPGNEIHFINMKAFVDERNTKESNEIESNKFTNWLTLITHNDLDDKEAINKMCEEEDEMMDAMEKLVRLSQDVIRRQAYQRRQDELRTYNHVIAQIAIKDAELAIKDAELADKDAELADKDAIIGRLTALLNKEQ